MGQESWLVLEYLVSLSGIMFEQFEIKILKDKVKDLDFFVMVFFFDGFLDLWDFKLFFCILS